MTTAALAPDSDARPTLLFAKARTQSTFEEIPVINLENARSNDPLVRRALADEIRNACINVGFFYIKNHGIPEDTIRSAVDAGKGFFALPTDEKMTIDIHKSSNFKGYTALLGENTDPANRGDMHEGFDIGWEEPAGNLPSAPTAVGHDKIVSRSTATEDGAMSGENVWPDERDFPGFKQRVLSYYHSAVALGKTLFPLFALALDLPEGFFDDKTLKPAAVMRLLHYPPQNGIVDDRVIGIGAHTDYECFTILWQDTVPALQVLNANGKWIDAVPIPGTVVINLGDQFARWTNDIFKSTVHRAVNRTGAERYSIPLFFGTDYSVKLEPLPGCVSDDYPAKYDIVTAGDYVKSRLEATYAHSK